MPKVFRSLFVILLSLSLGACTPIHQTPTGPEDVAGYRRLNAGYSLLYKLMSDESGVTMLFWLKHADDSVTTLVKAVGERCQAAKKEMDGFSQRDKQINFDAAGLPEIEQKCRELEAEEKRHELLGSSGKEFELNLIFSQAEAMSYANNLCGAMAKVESDPGRKNFLVELGKQCGDFHERCMKMLAAR